MNYLKCWFNLILFQTNLNILRYQRNTKNRKKGDINKIALMNNTTFNYLLYLIYEKERPTIKEVDLFLKNKYFVPILKDTYRMYHLGQKTESTYVRTNIVKYSVWVKILNPSYCFWFIFFNSVYVFFCSFSFCSFCVHLCSSSWFLFVF